jgi:disulfide bond formation protein DsbB
MKTRVIILMLLLLIAAVLLAGCGGGAATSGTAPKSAGDATKGKTLFVSTCSSCHGPDAKGLPGLGKDMTTSTFIKGQTDAQLLDFIKKGRPATDPANTTKVDMPPKGGNPALSDKDLEDIIAFMRSISK